METMKITQALAEIKLAGRKIESSTEFVLKNVKRDDRLRDPFEKEKVTQEQMVNRELQSIEDNEKRIVALRTAINKANIENSITIEGVTKTIAEWIIWRRDILPGIEDRLHKINRQLEVTPSNSAVMAELLRGRQDAKSQDVINYVFNVSEKNLLEKTQTIQAIAEKLDGMLSLVNANIDITI